MTENHDRSGVARIAADLLHVRRVFGEPIVAGDVTLVPVALVTGTSGFGGGEGMMGAAVPVQGEGAQGSSTGSGEGGGFGVHVRPLGTYVVSGSQVRWEPALDLLKIILGGQAVGAVALIALSCAIRKRRRR